MLILKNGLPNLERHEPPLVGKDASARVCVCVLLRSPPRLNASAGLALLEFIPSPPGVTTSASIRAVNSSITRLHTSMLLYLHLYIAVATLGHNCTLNHSAPVATQWQEYSFSSDPDVEY